MLWYQSIFGNMPIKGISEKKLAKYETDREFINVFMKLYNMALNTFRWVNLPKTCNERFLEISLVLCGSAVLVEENGGFINLGFASGENLNVYGEPLNGWGYGLNGWNKQYKLYVDGMEENDVVLRGISQSVGKRYDGVMCRDNRISYPYISYLVMAASRLTSAMRCMDVIAQNLKQPAIITCEESMVKSVKDALNQRNDNISAIISSGKLPIDTFKVWDTKANPETLKAVWEHYERVENQVMELLGVNNLAQVNKKERLLVDEVNANNDETEFSVDFRLRERQLFCDRVNRAFNLNISVELNVPHGEEDEAEVPHGEEDEVDEGGEDDV